MTHYTVMVQIPKEKARILKSNVVKEYVEGVFVRYDENREVEPYVNFTREKCIKRHEEDIAQLKENISEAMKIIKKGEASNHDKKWVKWAKKRLALLEEGGPALTWGEYTWDKDQKFTDDGEPLTTYNPESKWDWWSLGGRWAGKLRIKGSKEPHDFARVKELDMDAMREEWDKYQTEEIDRLESAFKSEKRRKWDSPELKAEHLEWIKKQIEAIKADTFKLTTCAVLTKDGEWHEPAKMGWFGCTYDRTEEPAAWDAAFKKRFLDPLDPDDVIVITDCHI